MKSKFINTFDTTAEYNNYIESAYPEFPNVGYDKQAGKVNIRRQSPNDYQIWGTTTATSNFNIKLNDTNVEVTVDPDLGEFYLTGWTGTLTSLNSAFYEKTEITSIKKFALDVSSVTSISSMFDRCSALTYLNLSTDNSSGLITTIAAAFKRSGIQVLDLSGWDLSNANSTGYAGLFENTLTDIYITVEGTLNRLTNNLTSQGADYVPSSATIHYNGTDYKWQNNAWTPQS